MYRCEGPPREPEIPDAARIAAGSAGYIRRVIRGPRTALVIVLAAWLALAPPAAVAKKRKHRPAPCSLSPDASGKRLLRANMHAYSVVVPRAVL